MYVLADFMNFCCVGLHFSTFSIIAFTLSCVAWLPVSYLFRHPSKNALISLLFLLFHLLWIALHDCQSRTFFGTLQKTLLFLYFFYYSIYFQLRYMIASLVPFSAPFKKRSHFSTFSIIPFTFNCVTWLPVSYLFRHPSKNALISLLFLLFHLLWIALHDCQSRTFFGTLQKTLSFLYFFLLFHLLWIA